MSGDPMGYETEYNINAGADLELVQSGAISQYDWNLRQRSHCEKFYAARYAANTADEQEA